MAQGRRIVFMGTSSFAATILAGLHKAGADIAGVYTQPDRAAGRGLKVRESPVKLLSRELNLPVAQPPNFKDEDAAAALACLEPDFLVVASYGLILPQKVLNIPTIAPINVHASLLPAYRGAAPIQRAIMENWGPGAKTGVCVMGMEEGMDTGPVYVSREVPIGDNTAPELTDILAHIGSELLLDALPKIADGSLRPVAQNVDLATYAAKLAKEDGKIDWSWPAARVDALIRAVTGWPGAQTTFSLAGREIPVILDKGAIGASSREAPGVIKAGKNGISIACGDNWYELGRIRPLGRPKMAAKDFANGLRLADNTLGRAV